MNRLNIKAAGLAVGVLCGAVTIVIALSALFFGYGALFVDSLAQFYIGYGPTFWGAVIGGVWSFIDGFIAGVVLAWLYNKFVRNT